MFKKMLAMAGVGIMAAGLGLATAAPASAEQRDMFVFRHAATGAGGCIAYETVYTTPTKQICSGQWFVTPEGDGSRVPQKVYAGGGWCVKEEVFLANTAEPDDRTWHLRRTYYHGSGLPRAARLLGYTNIYDAKEIRSMESRLSVYQCPAG